MRDRAIITSALPYANGEIHLGHVASTYLPADITVRFLRQMGTEAYYVCASDDYGTPILIQSEKENKSASEYSAHWNGRAQEDLGALDIHFDVFDRTSSDENIRFVQDVFMRLRRAGHIYESDVVQFYCERDEKFLPDRYVTGTCPHCNAIDQYSDLCEKCGRIPEEISNPRCAICGDAPVKRSSRHYFLRLHGLEEKLGRWLESNANLQPDVKKYVQNWIKSGLVDWDITRDIPWGVPVPLEEAKGKVFYGWFDNHLAYITASSKISAVRDTDSKEFWNSAVIYHFIGKDIVYHHYLFVPAVRLYLGDYKLPDHIPTRGHLTLESRKISKSRNWYIGLRKFLEKYPADYLRFYLSLISPYSQDDLNFEWEDYKSRINSELIGNVGNFVNRALGFTARSYEGMVPEPGDLRDADAKIEAAIHSLAGEAGSLLQAGNIDRALKKILEFTARLNQYFQHCEPWKGGEGAQRCVYTSVNAVQSLSIVLYPFIPGSAQRMWEQLGMKGAVESQPWESASDMVICAGHKIGAPEPLFAKVELE